MERSGSHLPQALAVKQIMDCTLDGWWGFLWFFPATMLIEMMLIGNRVGGVCAAIVHSVIL
jgi:hypothetical protein